MIDFVQFSRLCLDGFFPRRLANRTKNFMQIRFVRIKDKHCKRHLEMIDVLTVLRDKFVCFFSCEAKIT